MASGSLGLTQFNNMLKDMYGDVGSLFNDEIKLFSIVSRNKTPFTGRDIIEPIENTRNFGDGARNEREQLPAAGYTGHIVSTTTLKYNYLTVEFTGQVIEHSKTDEGSFKRSAQYEMRNALAALKRQLNRQAWGNGTGRLARIRTLPGGVTVGVAYHANASELHAEGVRYLAIGMPIQVYSTAGVSRGTATVASIDLATNVITLDAIPAGTIVGDILCKVGAYGREIMGMWGLVSDGDTASDPKEVQVLQGIDRATTPEFRSSILRNATVRVLSELLMQQAIDSCFIRSEGIVTRILTDFSVRNEYVSTALNLATNRRFMTTRLEGGFEKADYNGILVDCDVDCPYGTLWFINEKYIQLAESRPLGWDNTTGSIMEKISDANGSFDMYRASMKVYHNLKTTFPTGMARLCAIQTNAPVAVPIG